MPTEAICFIIDNDNNKLIVKSIYELLEFLCKQNIPHNIFITPDRAHEFKRLKLFIYARENHCNIKDLTALNLAFCELSGYIPVGGRPIMLFTYFRNNTFLLDTGLYENLSEELVIERIKEESRNVYDLIYKFLNEL